MPIKWPRGLLQQKRRFQSIALENVLPRIDLMSLEHAVFFSELREVHSLTPECFQRLSNDCSIKDVIEAVQSERNLSVDELFEQIRWILEHRVPIPADVEISSIALGTRLMSDLEFGW
jgi:hypothetical protein